MNVCVLSTNIKNLMFVWINFMPPSYCKPAHIFHRLYSLTSHIQGHNKQFHCIEAIANQQIYVDNYNYWWAAMWHASKVSKDNVYQLAMCWFMSGCLLVQERWSHLKIIQALMDRYLTSLKSKPAWATFS